MNINKIMEEAKKMQKKMQETQQKLSELIVEGQSGCGMVQIKMNGCHEVRSGGVKINPSLKDNISMLEDLIAGAINDAKQKIDKISKEKINELTFGLNISTDFLKDNK